jgi:integrase
MKRESTKYTGVYQRVSNSREHEGKPDICFDIAFKLDKKLIWEKIGWLSEGYSPKLASGIRSERLRSIRHSEELPQQKKKAPYFNEIAQKYLDWSKENKSRAGRDDNYLYKNHLETEFQNKRADEITNFDLERLKGKLKKKGARKDESKKKGLSPASIKHCLVLIRQIYNKALLWGLYSGQNPVRGVKMPTVENQRERFLSHEEAKLLLTTLHDRSKTLHDMALMALHCGLRAGEIFNLKGQDIDFNNRLINIADPKNKHARKAFMTNDVFSMLSGRKAASPGEYIFIKKRRSPPENEGTIREIKATNKQDKDNNRKVEAVSAVFRKIVNKLGFNDSITDPRQIVTFHSLRHTFASWLALQGETQLTIKELLGHRSLNMTERYSHLIPDHKRRAIISLEKAFKAKKKVKKAGQQAQTGMI